MRLMDCIRGQTILPSNLIVLENISDGSVLNPGGLEKKFRETKINVELNKLNYKNAAESRQFGLDRVSTRWVIFLDNDIAFANNFFEMVLSELTENRADGVVGKVWADTESVIAKTSEYLCNHIYHGEKKAQKVVCFGMAAVGFDTDKIRKKGLSFDTSLNTGEDTDFFLSGGEKGLVWVMSPKLEVYHRFENKSIVKALKRNMEYGKDYLSVEAKHSWFHFCYFMPTTRSEWLWLVPKMFKKSWGYTSFVPSRFRWLAVMMIMSANLGVYMSYMGKQELRDNFQRSWKVKLKRNNRVKND